MRILELAKLSQEEAEKLNITLFHLTQPPPSSVDIVYERDDARSFFHNSQDIMTGTFYKHSSSFMNSEMYEKLR